MQSHVLREYLLSESSLTILCCIPEIPDDIVKILFTKIVMSVSHNRKILQLYPEESAENVFLIPMILNKLSISFPEQNTIPLLPPYMFLEQYLLENKISILPILVEYWRYLVNIGDYKRCILSILNKLLSNRRFSSILTEITKRIVWENLYSMKHDELRKIYIIILESQNITEEWISNFLEKQKLPSIMKREWLEFKKTSILDL